MNDIFIDAFAHSLFELALEEDALDSYFDAFNRFSECYLNVKGLKEVLSSDLVDEEKVKELVAKYFKDDKALHFESFLFTLRKKKAMNVALQIHDRFNSLYYEHKGELEGIIYAARPLSEEQIKQIEAKLASMKNKKVHLKLVIDESLIGGFEIKINDELIASSLKDQLETLRNTLKREAI